MKIEDSRKLIAEMMITYPNYSPADTEMAARIWLIALEEYTVDQVNMAFKTYIKNNTSGFAPCPGQIVDEIYKANKPEEMNAEQAWSLVNRAIRNSGYSAVEEFAKLPPLVQEAVGQPNVLMAWGTDENFSEDVAMSNFARTYNTVLKRQEETDKLSPDMRQMIEMVNKGSYLSELRLKNQNAVNCMLEENKSLKTAITSRTDGVDIPEELRNAVEKLKQVWESED